MFIDFHTHAFSEKIVKKAMSNLESTSGIKSHTDGTVSGMLELMDKNGIDKSVLLPIATKPSQQTIINNWASEVKSQRIYPFGSVHPDACDAVNEVERIKELGLYGVKLHPDYQQFYTDDKKIYPILKKCSELGLMVVFHAGYDPLSPDDLHSSSADFAAIHENFPELTIILAHLGGMYRWEQVERYLAGRDGKLYFDISFTAGEIGVAILSRIINKHGADRILLASDCPWDNPANEIKMIESLDISREDKEKIFYKNAARLLNIEV